MTVSFKGIRRKNSRVGPTEKRPKNSKKRPKNSIIKPVPGEGITEKKTEK